MKCEKLVLVTRADLPAGAQAVQAAHALREFAESFPDVDRSWHAGSNTLALLAVPNEAALVGVLRKAQDRGIRVACFREPDFGDQLTALAVEPSQAAQRLCRALPLALAPTPQPVAQV